MTRTVGTAPSPGPASTGDQHAFSQFRMPLLMWVASQRAVTLHQALHRFWVLDGCSASHGFRVVRRLVRDGLLESHLLHPRMGRASPVVLTPGRAGWRELGQPIRTWPIHRLDDVLQFSHVCLVREATGWTIVPPDRVWPVARRRALDILRQRSRRDEAAQEARRWIERMRPDSLGLWALHHAATGAVRFVVNVRSFAGAVRACERLLPIRLAGEAEPFNLELTGGNREQVEAVRDRIIKGFSPRVHRDGRHAALGRKLPSLPLIVHMAPDFRALPHPSAAPIPPGSVYESHGAASPLTLRTAAPWLATRVGGIV